MSITTAQIQDLIDSRIKTNGRNLIDGSNLNFVLSAFVDYLNGLPTASGSNLGNSDLVVDSVGFRNFDFGGNLGTDGLKMRNNAGVDQFQFGATGDLLMKTGRLVTGGGVSSTNYGAILNKEGSTANLHIATNSNAKSMYLYKNGGSSNVYIYTTGGASKTGIDVDVVGAGTQNVGIDLSVTGGTKNTALKFTAGDIEFPTSGSGTKVGQFSTELMAFWGATPITQPAHIADVTGTPTGTDAAIIADLQTKLNTLLAQMASLGLQAAS